MSKRVRRVCDAERLHVRVKKVLFVGVVFDRFAVGVLDQVLARKALF